jgi:hypothetical protein
MALKEVRARRSAPIPPKRPSPIRVAFIAIIIVLAVIVLAACTGIFLLLRYWEPTEQERNRRRRFSIRRAGASVAHPLPIGLRDATPGAPVGSLSEKLGNMFRGRRQGSGWQTAPDDDEWDSGDEEMAVHRHERTSVGHAPSALRRTIVEPDAVFAPPGHASPLESMTPAAAVYENPFEPPPNPFLSDTARRPHVIGESGTHFREDI